MENKDLFKIASEFGTHDHCIELWIEKLKITEEELKEALSSYTKRQRFCLILRTIRPKKYLLEHPALFEDSQTINVETIQALPKEVFEEHLEQLKIADRIGDEINKREFPYNEYDAQVFATLYHCRKKADIAFIHKMFSRSISHSSYPGARQKLAKMAQPLGV